MLVTGLCRIFTHPLILAYLHRLTLSLIPLDRCTPSIARVSESALEDTLKMSTMGLVHPKEIHGWTYIYQNWLRDRFLCTSAAAEIIYLTALDAVNNQSIQVTSLSNPFYQRFVPSISAGTYPLNSSEFAEIVYGMITFGDSFLSTVQQHAFENGSISEEFDRYVISVPCLFRYIGYCVGARDLTWSYVAFQTASDARQRLAVSVNESELLFRRTTTVDQIRFG